MDIPRTIAEAAVALRSRSISSSELVGAAFANADRLDDQLRVYVKRFDEAALSAARAADRDFAAGIDRGALQGIPVGVKDIIFTREAPTTGLSLVKNPAWEALRDAPVVAKLRAAGAVITGKTTTMELAIGVPDPSRPLTECRNPWNPAHWSGGSSSGSAAGVATQMFLGAVGTDTAGSIRLPAAYCGTTGLRQTSGRVSREDVIPLASSLDVVGPIARTAADAATMLQVMAGRVGHDPFLVDVPTPDFSQAIGESIKGLRVGVERSSCLHTEAMDPEAVTAFEEAVSILKSAGAVAKEIELPYYEEVIDAVMVTMLAEGAAYHHRELRDQWENFTPPTRLAFATGAMFSAAEYAMAQKVRRAVRRLLRRTFEEVDVIVAPTTATVAPKLAGFTLDDVVGQIFTHYWSGLGVPAVSIPMGMSDAGLPLGLQIAGRHFEEVTVLQVASEYQRLTDWHQRIPPGESARTVEENTIA